MATRIADKGDPVDADAIDRLEAGRDLDALVAEKVMGWQRVEEGLPYFWPTREMMGAIKKQHPDILAVDYFPCPNFSTDIAAAWEVVTKMVELNLLSSVNQHSLISGKEIWSCLFWGWGKEDERYFCVEASNAPLAICRAAMKVINNTNNADDH